MPEPAKKFRTCPECKAENPVEAEVCTGKDCNFPLKRFDDWKRFGKALKAEAEGNKGSKTEGGNPYDF